MSLMWVDNLVNWASGMGVWGRDKAASSMYMYIPLGREQLEAAYLTDWICNKVVDIPADDSTREWRSWKAQENQIEQLEAVEKSLNLQRKMRDAMVLARLYGGSVMVMGVGSDKDFESELNPDSVGKGDLKFIHVMSRWAVNPGKKISDLMSPFFGEPEYYEITSTPEGQTTQIQIQVHPSRVVRINARGLPAEQSILTTPSANLGWGEPVLQKVYEACRNTTTVINTAASLVQEAKFDIIKIPNLSMHMANADYQNRLSARFSAVNIMKSNINAVLFDKEEEWDRVQAEFGSFPELIRMFLLIASGAADIPATRFIGQSPAGLSATGESDMRNYYDRIASDQETDLTPTVTRLDEVLIRSALGSRDKSIYYEWNSLWQMSEIEKADIDLKKAQAFQIDNAAGLIDPEALRIGRQNQLIECGVYPGLEQALEAQDQLDISSMMTPEEQSAEAEANSPPQPGVRGQSPPQGGYGGNVVPFDNRDEVTEFDPGKHPRAPKGSPTGGQFIGGQTGEEPITHPEPTDPNEEAKAHFASLEKRGSAPESVRYDPERYMNLSQVMVKNESEAGLKWEYEKEYLKYAQSAIPDAFSNQADFNEQYRKAPLQYLDNDRLAKASYTSFDPLHPPTLEEVRKQIGHRRDVSKIKESILSGTVTPPIFTERDGKLRILAGNSRLGVSLAMGLKIPVKVINVDQRVPTLPEGQLPERGGDKPGGMESEAGLAVHGQVKGVKEHEQPFVANVTLGKSFVEPDSKKTIDYEGKSFKILAFPNLPEASSTWKNATDYDVLNEHDNAIRLYTDGGHGPLNRSLRGVEAGVADKEFSFKKIKDQIEGLDSLYDKPSAAFRDDLVTFRGFNSKAWQQVTKDAKIGSILVDEGYVSSSTKMSVAKGFMDYGGGGLAEILVPKGARAISTLNSTFPNEAEVLIDRSSRFEILKLEKSGTDKFGNKVAGRIRLLWLPPESGTQKTMIDYDSLANRFKTGSSKSTMKPPVMKPSTIPIGGSGSVKTSTVKFGGGKTLAAQGYPGWKSVKIDGKKVGMATYSVGKGAMLKMKSGKEHYFDNMPKMKSILEKAWKSGFNWDAQPEDMPPVILNDARPDTTPWIDLTEVQPETGGRWNEYFGWDEDEFYFEDPDA